MRAFFGALRVISRSRGRTRIARRAPTERIGRNLCGSPRAAGHRGHRLRAATETVIERASTRASRSARTFPSETLRWLADGFRAEYVSGLGHSYALHLRGGTHRSVGDLVPRVQRIVDDAHVLWSIERDLNTPGDWHGRGLRPKRDARGQVIRHAEEWLQPFHEGVKRLAPRGERRGYCALRRAWLVAFLGWRGEPCLCAHADITEHLAADAGVPTTQVVCAIERAAREAARLIGDRVRDNPIVTVSV